MSVECLQNYPTPAGFLRVIRFVHENGELLSMNYAYLVSVRFVPDGSTIEIAFTTYHVTLKGYKLQSLFEFIEIQQAQIISCIGERYKEAANQNAPIVTEIISTALS